MDYLTSSAGETQKLAQELAKKFKNHGGVVALVGDLGTGKTTFTQGFAQGLGIKDKIISPTFVLIRQHKLPNSNRWLFHLDLYRLEKAADFSQLGLEELFSNNDNVILIEWAEKVLNQLPPHSLKLKFEKIAENKRKITFED